VKQFYWIAAGAFVGLVVGSFFGTQSAVAGAGIGTAAGIAISTEYR
jgi:hypothetical protein